MSSYWRNDGFHLVQAKGENREGIESVRLLSDTAEMFIRGNVLDYGCGKGRFAHLFSANHYLGYDVNEQLVSAAAEENPAHRFTTDLATALAYDADATLMYTVISMWPDAEAMAILSAIKSRLIIIGEIADKRWATASYAVPPIYNRDVSQFDKLMMNNGYVQVYHRMAEHERYATWKNEYDKHMHIVVYEHEGHRTIDRLREDHIWGARADGVR